MADDGDDDLTEAEKEQLSPASRLLFHEKICSFRYKTINARLRRMEGILVAVAGMLLSGMAWMLFELITKTPSHN